MPPEPVYCPKCGNQVGTSIEVNGVRMLATGGAFAAEYHGACASCWTEFHWSVKMQKVLLYFRMMTGREVSEEELEKP